MDLRSYIESPLRLSGLSTEFEIARALYENPNETLYFEDVKNYKFDVVGNVIKGRDAVYQALSTSKKDFIKDVSKFLKNPIEPVVVEKGPCQEQKCSLYDIPILKHFEKDGSRYITSGIVIAKDPEHGRNSSIHRLMIHENNRMGIRIVPRHLREYFDRAEERGEDLEVAIAIGIHPQIFFASSYSPPLGYDEFSLAGGILGRPIEMVKCKTIDVEVPSTSNFVIEGRILCGQRFPEGPFADVTGTYDRIRDEPVIEVNTVTHRKNAIYQALLPSSIEHRLFMGMPREPRIYNSVSAIANVSNACLTDGGKNWLHGAISLRKGKRRNIKGVIEKAFEGHPSMKHVVIVDDDIDIFDSDQLEYAVSTRFQGDHDAYLFKGMRGSTLDPSTDEDGKTAKVGLDATIPLDREDSYEFARIP